MPFHHLLGTRLLSVMTAVQPARAFNAFKQTAAAIEDAGSNSKNAPHIEQVQVTVSFSELTRGWQSFRLCSYVAHCRSNDVSALAWLMHASKRKVTASNPKSCLIKRCKLLVSRVDAVGMSWAHIRDTRGQRWVQLTADSTKESS